MDNIEYSGNPRDEGLRKVSHPVPDFRCLPSGDFSPDVPSWLEVENLTRVEYVVWIENLLDFFLQPDALR